MEAELGAECGQTCGHGPYYGRNRLLQSARPCISGLSVGIRFRDSGLEQLDAQKIAFHDIGICEMDYFSFPDTICEAVSLSAHDKLPRRLRGRSLGECGLAHAKA